VRIKCGEKTSISRVRPRGGGMLQNGFRADSHNFMGACVTVT